MSTQLNNNGYSVQDRCLYALRYTKYTSQKMVRLLSSKREDKRLIIIASSR